MKNKYFYKFIVGIEFEADKEAENDIQKCISGVLETSIKKSASIIAGHTLDITRISAYSTDKINMTEKEEKERLKKIKAEKREKRCVNPRDCSQDVQDIYYDCLSGTTDQNFKELLFVSEKHILFKVIGRTVHLQRTDYTYSPPEYFLINIKNAKSKPSKYKLITHFELEKDTQITEFHKEGRLTKEDKQQIYKIIGQEIKL